MAFRSCKSISPISHFIYDTLIHHTINHNIPTISRFFETQSLSKTSNFTKEQAITISYLTQSCGLSRESAIKASRKINIKSTKKPNSVLELLRSHGFTQHHISRLISRRPALILANPETVLKPKIEYFEMLGLVGPDLASILCSCNIICSSLEQQIKPSLNFLKRYVGTDKNLVHVLKQSVCVALHNVEEVMAPNIETLRAEGVPETAIGQLIMLHPGALMRRVEEFKEFNEAAKERGFDPKRGMYIFALHAMARNTKLNWEKKKAAYMSFGWSEIEFNSAFKLYPKFMHCSEKKMWKMMDFFVHKAGLRASEIAKCPGLLLCSLERRIIPRYSVLQTLMSKALIGKDVSVARAFISPTKYFESRFLTKFKDVAPEVIKAYEGEIEFQGSSTRLKDNLKSEK